MSISTALLLIPMLNGSRPAYAADHGDAPAADQDRGADIGDTYLFLDPNDNTKLVIIATFHGFIVPGEAPNFAAFDQNIKYKFKIENTGNAKADETITVTFAPRVGSSTAAQMAKIKLPDGTHFFAPTTPPNQSATAPAPVITTDPASSVEFFAGETDDPFFFDITAFARFTASVKAGKPDTTVFSRGRDTFAGYNTLAIAMSFPVNYLRGSASSIALDVETRRGIQQPSATGGFTILPGAFQRVDREGNPAVNVVLIPFDKKDAYNAADTQDDAAGLFAPDIIATLKSFGTDDTSIGILAGIAVTNGDFLRLNLSIANTGTGGGTNPEAAFPNGRRLGDDIIDTYLTLINNRQPLGDNVDANDVPFRDTFPFLAPAHQPQATGVTDDSTRN